MSLNTRDGLYRLAIVLLLTLMARAAVLYIGAQHLHEDPDSYARLAINWAASGVYGFEMDDGEYRPTAFRPPLYPWMLSWLVANDRLQTTAVAWLHLCMGLGTVWLTLSIGVRLGLRWTSVAALAVAVDPLLLRGSQLLMTETLATLLGLIVWRIWLATVAKDSQAAISQPTRATPQAKGSGPTLWQTSRQLGLGLALGLSILARPTAAPWAILCLLCLMFLGDACWKRRLLQSLLVAVGISICVVPWTLRNWQLLGQPIWATSHGGYTLLLANNPSLYQHFVNHGPSRAWSADSFHEAWAERSIHDPKELLNEAYWTQSRVTQPADGTLIRDQPPAELADTKLSDTELADDAVAYAAAKATIARHPRVFLLSIFYRIGWFWALWPNAEIFAPSTIGIGLWYLISFGLAITGLGAIFRCRDNVVSWFPALMLIFSLTAVHSIYWSNMRFRASLMPAIYLLAVQAPWIPRIAQKINDLSASHRERP